MSFRHILVAIDFGEASIAALRLAFRLADPLGAKVDILHVIVPPPAAEDPHGTILEASREMARAGVEELVKLFADAPALGRCVLLYGDPTQVLLDAAIDSYADLLVLGINGGLGAKSGLLGGVAEGVLRSSRCPVVVARPAELTLIAEAEERHNQ